MTAIIILAAGSSSRFGSPKQNLNYQGETLLQLAVKNALVVSDQVLVVLGANREAIEHSIKDNPIDIVYNSAWTEGMASSIRIAVEKLQTEYLQADQIIIMLCDQPFANAAILQQLVDKALTTDKSIVACAYNNTLGVPVLFKPTYFPYLLALKGHDGAKKLLAMHADDVEPVSFPLGAVDIDTVGDWEELERK